jgi:hypothetical protein
MYEKPRLQRFGSFGELTQIGGGGAGDSLTVFSPITNAPIGSVPSTGPHSGCVGAQFGNQVVRCSL